MVFSRRQIISKVRRSGRPGYLAKRESQESMNRYLKGRSRHLDGQE